MRNIGPCSPAGGRATAKRSGSAGQLLKREEGYP